MPASLRRTALRTLNFAVVAVFIWAVQHYWGWGRLLTPWRHLTAAMTALAVLGMLASYALRALRVYLAEPDIPRGQLGQSLRLILVSNVFNLLLPMRSGEASFPILMRRWFGTDLSHAAGTLVWLRVLDLHVIAAIGVVCAARGWLGSGLATDAALAVAALCVAAPVAAHITRHAITAFLEKRPSRVSMLLLKAAKGLPRNTAGLLRDLALTWLGWGVKLASLGFIFAKLAGIPLSLGVLGAIGGDLSTVLPIHAPGGFGTYEAGVMILTTPAHDATAQLLAAAVNLHLLVLTTALVAGAFAWLAPGKKGNAEEH